MQNGKENNPSSHFLRYFSPKWNFVSWFYRVFRLQRPQKKSLFPKPGLTLAPTLTLYRTKKNKTKADLIYIIDNIDSSHSVFICNIYVYLHVYMHAYIHYITALYSYIRSLMSWIIKTYLHSKQTKQESSI